MRGQAFTAAAAILSALAFAQPAAAQNYPSYHDEHVANQQQCQRSQRNRTVGGAVIGGVIGALLGREVANRGVRGEGTALGAVVGAAAGGAIGRNTARCNDVPQGSYDPYYGQSQDGYYGEGDGYGGPYQESDYGYGANDAYNRDDCRIGQRIVRDRYGREYREEVRMCRDRYGEWRAID